MSKTTFTAKQLEDALTGLVTIDKDFPDYPLANQRSYYELWDESSYPVTFREVGDDKNVHVTVKEHFDGEEGGDHRMYTILQVGWGSDVRYFEKTGEYNSWDSSQWDGGFNEVESKVVKKTEWVTKK